MSKTTDYSIVCSFLFNRDVHTKTFHFQSISDAKHAFIGLASSKVVYHATLYADDILLSRYLKETDK